MPPRDPRPMEVLALRAKAGSLGATDAMVRRRLPRVRDLVRYVVGDGPDLDDVVQVAIVTVLHGLPTFRGDGDFVSWMDRIVVRAALAFAKRRTRQRLRHADDDVEHALPDARPSLDDAVEGARVLALLEKLPAPQRAVVAMHHLGQLSVAEIATELGVPIETVRTRLRTGLTKLRVIVSKRGG